MKRQLLIFAILTLQVSAGFSQTSSRIPSNDDSVTCIPTKQFDWAVERIIELNGTKALLDTTARALDKANQTIKSDKSIIFIQGQDISELRANEIDLKSIASDMKQQQKDQAKIHADREFKTAFGCAGGFVFCLGLGLVFGYILHR